MCFERGVGVTALFLLCCRKDSCDSKPGQPVKRHSTDSKPDRYDRHTPRSLFFYRFGFGAVTVSEIPTAHLKAQFLNSLWIERFDVYSFIKQADLPYKQTGQEIWLSRSWDLRISLILVNDIANETVFTVSRHWCHFRRESTDSKKSSSPPAKKLTAER